MSRVIRPLESLAPAPVGPFKRRPSGEPAAIRHRVAYHSLDVMGYEFFECTEFAILTDKVVRDHIGDIVWVIGRKGGTKRYYLDVRFRVCVHRLAPQNSGFRFRVAGIGGIAFFPTPDVTKAPWFQRLMAITSDLSVGFQHILDPVVLAGLTAAHEETLEVQRKEAWLEQQQPTEGTVTLPKRSGRAVLSGE